MLGEQADERGARQERRVADGADDRDPQRRAGRVVRAALIPTGKPSAAPKPHSTAPAIATCGEPTEQDEEQAREPEHRGRPQRRDAPKRSSAVPPNSRATVIAVTKTPKPRAPTASAVP